MTHKTANELETGMADVRAAPKDLGTIKLIVRRPGEDAREVIELGRLDTEHGLVGDDWSSRPSREGPPQTFAQLTLMNARYTELISDGTEPQRWAQAGDQLYIDLDISEENLPAGTRLSMGSAVVEISAERHTGCAKFSSRFGSEALKLTNTPSGRSLRLRGLNASVVQAGEVRTGDTVQRA
jgi:MOSC domain-containing protein YiiM